MPIAGQRTRPATSVRPLRYRFDSADQVSRHFHVAGGRVMLFYPCLLPMAAGEPVLLDVTFVTSEHHCPLRGAVVSRESGSQYVGVWLEFSAHDLVAKLKSETALPKRRHRRFATDLVVNVEQGEGMPVVGKLVDIGFGGARIAGVSMKTRPGDRHRLSLFARDSGAPRIDARTSWTHGAEIGVEFIRPPPTQRTAIAALVNDASRRLAEAYEATHPPFCRCLDGNAVAEPPVPRSSRPLAGFQ